MNIENQYLLDITEDNEIKSLHLDELITVIGNKDETITNLILRIEGQEKVILGLIGEITTLTNEIHQYRHYKSHPKDEYLIDFGLKNWRVFTYRQAISLRSGAKICAHVLKKNVIKSVKMLEFKQYLIDVDYKLI